MTKYYINAKEVSKDTFNINLELEASNYVYDNYDNILNEIYPPIKIGIYEYNPSDVLEKVDPVAYHCGMSDEFSHQLEEANRDLERTGICEINNTTFEIEEVEEEAEED